MKTPKDSLNAKNQNPRELKEAKDRSNVRPDEFKQAIEMLEKDKTVQGVILNYPVGINGVFIKLQKSLHPLCLN
jgi:5,10-methylene-tetrahydrofolate dehydrogenase/methenyl tetrahydrofolate cyclohydrolase